MAMRFKLENLAELCRTNEQESLRLEFKPCNELRPREGQSQEEIVKELSKDVSSFLNAAGGVVIYGIREHASCAKELDIANAFKMGEKQKAEWLTQLIRHHIAPSPSQINAYQVALDDRSWFLVVEIPQGQEAFQAKDKRFYKRVGPTRQLMEQYEIADAMRRERGALLEIRLKPGRISQPASGPAFFDLRLAVTSENYVSAEYGAIRISLVPPLALGSGEFGEDCEVENDPVRYGHPRLEVGEDNIRVRACKIKWGANHGKVVFPSDWYDFDGVPLPLQIRHPKDRPQTLYGLAAKLFTVNSQPRLRYFLLRRPFAEDRLEVETVDAERFERFLKEMPTENREC
jgi:hypothetical protein